MQRHTIAEVLAEAQARLRRLEPEEAVLASRQGWTLVDVRDSGAIAHDGAIPGAVEIPLSVLEWRIDPASDTHLAALRQRGAPRPHLPGRLLIEPCGGSTS